MNERECGETHCIICVLLYLLLCTVIRANANAESGSEIQCRKQAAVCESFILKQFRVQHFVVEFRPQCLPILCILPQSSPFLDQNYIVCRKKSLFVLRAVKAEDEIPVSYNPRCLYSHFSASERCIRRSDRAPGKDEKACQERLFRQTSWSISGDRSQNRIHQTASTWLESSRQIYV